MHPEQKDNEQKDADASTHKRHPHFFFLLISCIGVVYGDIGTSPLYAFREALHQIAKDGLVYTEIYGVLSLIIWALITIVTAKYVLLLLRADNKGEGGILALMSLVKKTFNNPFKRDLIMVFGIFGAALFYADAAITPAISVLSALEGLKLVTPVFEPFILALSVLIIGLLFSMQRYGTAKVSSLFGPITIIWFLSMAITGIPWIIEHPTVLFCINPFYALEFLFEHGFVSFFVLGAVFLAVTGAEALYADMGHFGVSPIQKAWLYFVFPCLILNYLGQGAMVLERPKTIENPFFLMIPKDYLLPMVLMATCATIIASQAVITGAFSMTQQAVQLGFLPRMEIRYTSGSNKGQIYIPKINTILLFGVFFLIIIFQDSSSLAAAYGIAVSATMVMTTILAYFYLRRVRKKSQFFTLALTLPLFTIECIFLIANSMRILQGGFVPVFFGFYLTILMLTWVLGSRYLAKKASKKAIRLTDFSESLDDKNLHTVKGTAIFFTGDPQNTPDALIKNMQYNQIIHEKNYIVTVVTSAFPEVPDSQRLHIEVISSRITRIIINFGFMESPDIPKALKLASWKGMPLDLANCVYFVVHRKIVVHRHRGLPRFLDKVYASMRKFAISEHEFFKLPGSRVVELGVQISI